MREFFQNVDMDANASEGMLEWMQTRILVKAFAVYWAAAPKGSMTYAFTHMGNFFLLLLLLHTPPSKLKIQPKSSTPSLEPQIPASRLKTQP